MKFSLKDTLFVIAALAVLFAQYPFVECVEHVDVGPQQGTSQIMHITYAYTLTKRFTAVVGAEILAGFAWWYWRRQQRTADRVLESG